MLEDLSNFDLYESESESVDPEPRDLEQLRVTRHTTAQISIEFEIKDFFEVPKIANSTLCSRSFFLADSKFCLEVYPNGREHKNWIALYLKRKSSNSDLIVSYTIGLKNADGSTFKCFKNKDTFKKSWDRFGTSKLLLRSQLVKSKESVAPNGAVTVFCTANIDCNNEENSESQALLLESYRTFSDNFKELFHNGYQTDVTIIVEKKTFEAHKSILAAHSPVFRSMFEVDMKEKESSTVNIDDIHQDTFQDFLLFLYSGNPEVVSSINAYDLYVAADKYDVKGLKTICRNCLPTGISVENFCDVIRLSDFHNELELKENATRFFIENADKILKTSKWLTLVSENIEFANSLILRLSDKYNNIVASKKRNLKRRHE